MLAGIICVGVGLVSLSDNRPVGVTLLIVGLSDIWLAVLSRAFSLALFDTADLMCVIAQSGGARVATPGGSTITSQHAAPSDEAIPVEGPPSEADEGVARAMFEEARSLLKSGKKAAARELLESIARDHPQTMAGKRAAQALADH